MHVEAEGYIVEEFVEALCYQPGHGFNSQWGNWNFSFK
jgi:hypothetical protein